MITNYISSRCFSQKSITANPPLLLTIAIDPGHVGRDDVPTNQKFKLNEKSLTLAVTKLVQSEFNQNGYKAIHTRDGDVFSSLDDLMKSAAKLNADLFISLHFNFADDKSVSGVDVFTLTPVGQYSTYCTKKTTSNSKDYPGNAFDNWNTVPGYWMRYSLKQRLKSKDKDVKHAIFNVLKDLTYPGILV
jgi:N-acetylmuramoyl-L-alanine amidase